MVTEQPTFEVRVADGALEAVEEHLRRAGFFAAAPAADVCAEVYLGYGLSEPLRRRPTVARPEPADLPLAACRVRHVDEPVRAGGAFSLGTWEPTWAADDYARAVGLVRDAIAEGEVYQVNLVQHLAAAFEGDPGGVAMALSAFAPLHPRPLAGNGWAIVSATPELFLAEAERLKAEGHYIMTYFGSTDFGGDGAERAVWTTISGFGGTYDDGQGNMLLLSLIHISEPTRLC